MSKRQQNWLDKGYTQEQINVHLRYEREKSKQSRERRKRNNEKNKEILKQIRKDLIEKTFGIKTITKINESNDGVGFWWHCEINFKDGSSGDFRYFYRFDDYTLDGFIKDIKYV